MLLLYIFILVLIFSCVPLLVSMTKKASEGATMRRALEKEGAKFIPTHTFWYMGSVDSKKCDFHVVFDKRVISVKVISFLSSNVFINFIDKENYEIQDLSGTKNIDKNSVVYKHKKKRPYDFKHKLPEEYASLPKAQVILINTPHPVRITVTKNGCMQDLKVSDNTGEGDLYYTYDFISLFK